MNPLIWHCERVPNLQCVSACSHQKGCLVSEVCLAGVRVPQSERASGRVSFRLRVTHPFFIHAESRVTLPWPNGVTHD